MTTDEGTRQRAYAEGRVTPGAAPLQTEADLRQVFGRNLRLLSAPYPSISGLCRNLGINRTQFNRYLSAESFPRPEVLQRICTFFDTDARILLQPVTEIPRQGHDLLSHPEIMGHLGSAATHFPQDLMPSGLYALSRFSFLDETKALLTLIRVYRRDGLCFMRGLESRDALAQQGLPLSRRYREYRGLMMRQDDGIAGLVARRGAITCSFTFMTRIPSFENTFWEGFTCRTASEARTGRRISRQVMEYLGRDMPRALQIARRAGLVDVSDLPVYHARLLRTTEPFR